MAKLIKTNHKTPSSFFVKTKSPRAYKAEIKKSGEIKKNMEFYTNEWLEGRISTEKYKELKRGFDKQTERLINSNFMRTYSVTMTENEFKLFSEFLEKTFSDKYEEERLLRLRFEDPDKYLEEVRHYRNNTRTKSKWEEDLDRRDSKRIGKYIGTAVGTIGGAIAAGIGSESAVGAAAGGALGGFIGNKIGKGIGSGVGKVKTVSTRVHDHYHLDPKKNKEDADEIRAEKKLAKEDPKAYKSLMKKHEDNLRVIDGEMTQDDFQAKYGHNPKMGI